MHFIINPRSGAAARATPLVQAFAACHGATVAFTSRPRHASDLATEAVNGGCSPVVAVGGDGTLNEVASALVGSATTLGLVPCGSGDGLGRHLGIHGPVKRALQILAQGHVRVIDTGLADGHPFFTAAGLGFEADVAHAFNQLKKRGFLRYLGTSASLFSRYRPFEVAIAHDGDTAHCQAFTLAVANSDQYGNNARIAPFARVDDGRLDLTVISSATLWRGLFLLQKLFSGQLRPSPNVRMRDGTRFVVTRPNPGFIHTDGEIHEAGTQVEFVVRERSLRILVPHPDPATYARK